MSCSICLRESAIGPLVTPCGHLFCTPCVYKWLQNHDTCPYCRMSPINISNSPIWIIPGLSVDIPKNCDTQPLNSNEIAILESEFDFNLKKEKSSNGLILLVIGNIIWYGNLKEKKVYDCLTIERNSGKAYPSYPSILEIPSKKIQFYSVRNKV